MRNITSPFLLILACIACAVLLSACSPKYDWREVRGSDAPYVVLLPTKPATHTRSIDLDGIPVTMTMTASDVDGVTFAVGSAVLPDAAQATQALNAMKTGLLRNIRGTIRQEKASATGAVPTFIEIEAGGAESRLLLARFLAKENRIYQAVVIGKEKAVSREAAETFLGSFKLN